MFSTLDSILKLTYKTQLILKKDVSFTTPLNPKFKKVDKVHAFQNSMNKKHFIFEKNRDLKIEIKTKRSRDKITRKRFLKGLSKKSFSKNQ